MKKLILLFTLAAGSALAQSTCTNIEVKVLVYLENGNVRTNVNAMKAGELKTINALVAAYNARVAANNADTNNAPMNPITTQRFVSNLVQERIDRMRKVWLQGRAAELQGKIGQIANDDDLDKAATELDKLVPK